MYLFDVVTFFMTLELRYILKRMRVTLQLRFVFVLHFEVFFITSQLRYVFVQCSNVF